MGVEIKQTRPLLYLSILLHAILKRLCTTQSIVQQIVPFSSTCTFNTIFFGPRWLSSGALIYENCYIALIVDEAPCEVK
jgi:hypothetical protein